MVGDPKIVAKGFWSPVAVGLGGRTVHLIAPVSTSSPCTRPERSPMTTVRLVTRALAVTLTLVRVGPMSRAVFQSSLPLRSRAYTTPAASAAYTRSLTTAGVPATGPVSYVHFTWRSPTVSGPRRCSATLYRVPSGSWLYMGQSFGSPETTSTPLKTRRGSSGSPCGRKLGGRPSAGRSGCFRKAPERRYRLDIHMIRLLHQVGLRTGARAPSRRADRAPGRCRAGGGAHLAVRTPPAASTSRLNAQLQ